MTHKSRVIAPETDSLHHHPPVDRGKDVVDLHKVATSAWTMVDL